MNCQRLLMIFIVCVSFYINDAFATDSLAIKAKHLKSIYNKVVQANDNSTRQKNEIEFFHAFPNNFKELNALYGYENEKPAPLYRDAETHIIQLFNELSSVNDTLYYKKIINIALDGKWDADAITYFQVGLTRRIIDNKELTLYLLKQYKQEDVISFWYFVFDGPEPGKQLEYNSGLHEYKSVNADMYALMMKIYKQVLKDNTH